MTDETVTEAPPVDPNKTPEYVEMAARIFSVYLPEWIKQVDSLSVKSVKRVLKALIKFPLNDESDQLLVHKDELAAFERAMELMEAKSLLINYAVSEKQKKEAAEEAAKQDSKEGQTNG